MCRVGILKPNQAYYTTKLCFVPLTFMKISSRTPKCMYSWIVPDILVGMQSLVSKYYSWNIWLNWIIKIDWLCSFQPKMRWKSIDPLFLWGPRVIYVKRHGNEHMMARDFHLSLSPSPSTLTGYPEETAGIMKGLKAVSSQVGAHSALAWLQRSSIHS